MTIIISLGMNYSIIFYIPVLLGWGGVGVLCNVGYSLETNLNTKSREISFAHKLLLSYQIVSKYFTEHGSDTVVLCAKCQNDLPNETGAISQDSGLVWISNRYPIVHNPRV